VSGTVDSRREEAMSDDAARARISDEKLADWYGRWPSTLPTSVPHEQVLMLIEDLRDCRSALATAEAERDIAVRYRDNIAKRIAEANSLRAMAEKLATSIKRVTTYDVSCECLTCKNVRAALSEWERMSGETT
jgi:hypothetical protein